MGQGRFLTGSGGEEDDVQENPDVRETNSEYSYQIEQHDTLLEESHSQLQEGPTAHM